MCHCDTQLTATNKSWANVLLLKQCNFHSDAHATISIDFRVLLYQQWLKQYMSLHVMLTTHSCKHFGHGMQLRL